MSNIAKLRPHLQRRFENHRIVFGYDFECQHKGNSDLGKRISL
jgi:hypothetical protein